MQIRAGALVAVGDLVWDVLMQTDSALLRGGDTTGKIQLAPGGSAANVAAWWARVGSEAAFVGSVGGDVFGDLIVADLRREGVTSAVTQIPGADTGIIVSIVEQDGQRSMITNQGADFQLLPTHLPAALLGSAGHVHITGWSLFSDPPRSAAVQAARLAKEAGASVSLDPASFQMIRHLRPQGIVELLTEMSVDVLFPNRDEAEELTGTTDPVAMAHRLRELFGCTIVALKLDKDGCYVLSDTQAAYVPARAVTAVDSTGAGDAFDAGFLAAYQHSHDVIEAAQYANRLASWVVERVGARPAVNADWYRLMNITPPATPERTEGA
jgi:ribokinase